MKKEEKRIKSKYLEWMDGSVQFNLKSKILMNIKPKKEKRWITSLTLWILFIVLFVSFIVFFTLTKQVDWKESSIGTITPEYKGVTSEYFDGKLRPYSITMTLGIIVAAAFSVKNFLKKGLDINHLSIGVIIVMPSALFMASFFGKYGRGSESFIELFYFWNGGMAIHGGFIGAMLSGIPLFYYFSRRSKVSVLVYADAILPNVLLGQVIGRWGNFFNHEVMGKPLKVLAKSWDSNWTNIESSGMWLPKWITNNTTMVASSSGSVDGVNYNPGDLLQMNPIFFWESLALLICWFIIVFIIPNIGKWISVKPWKEDPIKYEITRNKFGYSNKNIVWNQAYYRSEDNNKTLYLSENKSSNKYKESLRISKANNLFEYSSTKSGIAAFSFVFLWNLVRFCLELQRPDDHLFWNGSKTISLILIFLTMMIGLVGMLVCQYLLPRYFRKNGYLYEKEYFTI
ncbi:prolipoprotein diacylglyceryl transferase [Entomoplasma ellychniae]|uniref:Prolipoprotein diacylglyceryl transferase n=1 Tax=Entomoplasma ellychniae TaxID=2114 RepID=A0A8E2QW99_9MOLU|nr:prolipoprotein diacylglyceryl transferase family protein [Entomoplasma ellychniae]PPE04851.1 prolipoprotein diacylglyceryl transferase [Entomoplasma ellychniae]